jgi:superfamily II DNA/RNA helicase
MPDNLTEESPSFASLAINASFLAAIAKLGFEQPTPVQAKAIPLALAGKDLLVSAETGSGKTAAFLLPTLQRLLNRKAAGPKALILAPTRELARQIFDLCQQLIELTDLKVGLVTGGEDFRLQQNMIRRATDVVIATPGRLLELLIQETIALDEIDVLILDEADRMLDMGFSDDVLNIISHCPAQRQTLVFSATLNHYGVIKLADKILHQHSIVALNTLHDGHSNIEQQMLLADDEDHKLKLLTWLLQNETYEKALIFTNTRIKADQLNGPLRGKKLRVGVLHGEMDQKDRKRVMQLFHDGEIKILVSTDLAARGLDVKGINLVVNYDVPRNGIDYIHRIGRTGRADTQGITIAFVKHTEWNLMASIERFLKQKFTRRTIKELIGKYQGPKKVKASGKAALTSKNKPEAKKVEAKKVKIRERDKKNIGKRRKPSVKAES